MAEPPVAGSAPYTDPVIEEELVEFAANSLPEWYRDDERANEFLHLAAKVMTPAYTMARDWLTKQSLILEADEKTDTTPDWLGQHGRDRGVYRQNGETIDQFRSRLREIPDAVTRPAILAAVDAVLAKVATTTTHTVSKKWSFQTGPEDVVASFASAGLSAGYEGTDGEPVGCFKFEINTAVAISGVLKAVTGDAVRLNSWEEWGVPPGAVVTHIRCQSYKRRLAAVTGATDISHSFAVQVLGADNQPLAGGGSEGYLEEALALTTTVQPDWEEHTDMTVGTIGHPPLPDLEAEGWPVREESRASDTAVFMKLWWRPVATAGASLDWRLDELELVITYQTQDSGLQASMVEIPRDESFLGTWQAQASQGGIFARVGDLMRFTPAAVDYPYGFAGLPFDPLGRWKFQITISGTLSGNNTGTFDVLGISEDGVLYDDPAGSEEVDPDLVWVVGRLVARDDVPVDDFAMAYVNRGFRVGSLRPTIIVMLPYPTSEIMRLVVADLVRNLKAGGVIAFVERREIP